jgi:CYTH domain-containing protein
MKEIERKFLVKERPNLDNIEPIKYERYFLRDIDNKQVRIQRKGDKYELEKKTKIDDFEYEKEKSIITENEFIYVHKRLVWISRLQARSVTKVVKSRCF